GKKRLTMLTAYDYIMASIIDEQHVDMILVGDSVGTTVLGYPNTIPVTIEEMIHHTKAVVKATKNALVIIDMPFMSYQEGIEQAKRNAGRMMKESLAGAVKLEGGINMKDTIKAIVDIDIPVVGHVGLTPQSIHRMGGYRVQGKGTDAERLIQDALAVEEAGAFCIVLECVPRELAAEITGMLKIPTIGIGAGPDCDGQVLVIYDLLGLSGDFRPKFVKRYASLKDDIASAVKTYIKEVKEGIFPDDSHSFH
ncbi:MAG TPA: 3-methyl-2-oxobutanoate hydroxymethyltransferase, partial [Syntrophorhabdaceae bacterium]|nr:3-methyl-2-oxobutanoate hydroxymethyltransferase [Syntrophorhabdaceae bacterium]